MAYRALKHLNLGEGRRAAPGDVVAGADDWRNPRPWVEGGYIEPVPQEELEAVEVIGLALQTLCAGETSQPVVVASPTPQAPRHQQPQRRSHPKRRR